MVFLAGVGDILPEERLIFEYWGTIISLLALGIPYEVIIGLSENEIAIILGWEMAQKQRIKDEQDRQQRIANNR
tara:strand:+ start:455 stop:676 length:222 start_codon:yes stop_codon:yes gene_type:complete